MSSLSAPPTDSKSVVSPLSTPYNARRSSVATLPTHLDMTPDKEAHEYDVLANQFSTIVVISTFTVALIIAFLAFTEQVIGSAKSVTYEIGMLLSFIATGVHLAAILIAGRAGNLCYRRAKSLDLHLYLTRIHVGDFQKFRTICEHLQLVGTIIFIPSILFLVYFLFVQKVFVYILYGMSFCALVTVYRIGFWKISILWDDIRGVWARRVIRKKTPAHVPPVSDTV